MKVLHLIAYIAGTVLAFGCSTNSLHPVPKHAAAKEPLAVSAKKRSDDRVRGNRPEALARFASGISYELNNQSDLASEQFHQASLADPSNEPLAVESANRFIRDRQFKKAVEVLARAAQEPKASGNVFSALAAAYLASGETNSAISAGKTAVRKSPGLLLGYQILSDLLLRTGEHRAAIKLLDEAATQLNAKAPFLIGLGELYGTVYRSAPESADEIKLRAVEVLTRAAKKNLTNPNLRQKLADNLAQFEQWKEASEIYLSLLGEFKEVPLMRDALREKLTNLYLQSKDKSKAAEQMEAVVRESPARYPEAWYYLGSFAYDAKDYAKAKEYFERALLLNPEMEQAYYDLAGMEISTDQAPEALKTLERARTKFPNSFTVEFFSGLAWSRLKDYSAALKHMTMAEVIGHASERTRLNHLFYFQLGSTHERNKDYEQAEKYFKKCLELSPDFPDAANYLGFMWAERGVKLEEARELIEQAVKLEPDNAAYLDSLGWVLYQQKDYEAALQPLLKAIELNEEPDAVIYDHLGDVYHALKKNEKAHDAWKKSFAIEPKAEVKEKLDNKSSPL